MGLKPCPFCGGKAMQITPGTIYCINDAGVICGARLSVRMMGEPQSDELLERAANAWNQRTEQEVDDD